MSRYEKNTPELRLYLESIEKIPQRLQNLPSISPEILELSQVMARNTEYLQDVVASYKIPDSIIPAPFEAKQLSQLREYTSNWLRPVFEEVSSRTQELPSRLRRALLSLGEQGWYLDIEMPLNILWKLEKAIEDGSAHKAEDYFATYFEENLEEIEGRIETKFPSRYRFIRAAFKAHRNKEYVLSIPVLLAQVDGICKDKFDQYLFRKKCKKPQTAIYARQFIGNSFTSALLSPLDTDLPISASEKKRGEDFTGLNRHTVLHGESLDYDTKINSLKAISLLNYVSSIISMNESQD